MYDDTSSFTIELPELRKYKALDMASRLIFLLFWILWAVLFFGPTVVSRETSLGIMGIGIVLVGGFAIYAFRRQKILRTLLNRRFASEFSAHTGYEYPRDIDILEVKQTIAVRRNDGTVILWGVKRSTGSVEVSLVVPAKP